MVGSLLSAIIFMLRKENMAQAIQEHIKQKTLEALRKTMGDKDASTAAKQ